MPKILIIDDEPGMRQVITKILGPQGHTVITAEDGAQAVEICKKELPDVTFLDISLPDMDSFEILSALKRIRPEMPVVILSGFGEIELALDLVKQGCFDYISKPFKIEDFIKMTKKALAGPMKPQTTETLTKPAPINRSVSEEHPAEQPSVAQSGAIPQKKSKLITIAVSLAVVLVAATATYLYLNKAQPSASFSIPYSNPAALYWDGKNIWAADWLSEEVYLHKNDAKLSVEKLYKVTGRAPVGLACDSKSIWIANSFEGKIYRFNRDAGLTFSAEFKSPGDNPSGLYFDGENLWSMDFQLGKIYKHNMDSVLSVQDTYDSPAANPKGMFKNGEYYYIADSKTNKVFKVKADNFAVAGIYVLPAFENKTQHITGMAFDGKNIWSCADGVQKIFRDSLKSLRSVQQ